MTPPTHPLPTPAAPSGPGSVPVVAGGPEDLLVLVPYLLGFRPEESLVLMLLDGRRVVLTARLDLPAAGRSSREPSARLLDELAGRLRGLRDQHGASAMVLLAFSARPAAARQVLGGLVPRLRPHGLVEAVLVTERRWWSLTCPSGCCPAGGTPYDPSSHPVAAAAVYAGLAAAPDRASVATSVAGPDAGERVGLEVLAARVATETSALSPRRRSTAMSAAVLDFLARPRRLDDEECLRLAVLAREVAVRDVAWALLSRDEAPAHLDLWHQVVARAVAPYEVAPLCLLGMAAWVGGDGALQNCCAERALQIDPGCTMAGLLEEISRRALAPAFWDRLADELAAEVLGPVRGA